MQNINYSEAVNLIEKFKKNGPIDRYAAFCILIAKYDQINSNAILIINKLYSDGFITR